MSEMSLTQHVWRNQETRDKQCQINCSKWPPWQGVGIISGTAERKDCVSFQILQEYGGTHHDWLELNPNPNPMPNLTLTLTLCLTLILILIPNPNPNPKNRNLCGTTAWRVNVFRKLIITFRRVPWIILF